MSSGTAMRKRAFTLVEIMIVVLIIGVLLAMAVPNWINTRQRARQHQCLQNLKKIEDAKELLAGETGLSAGDPVQMTDIYPAYFRSPGLPVCSEGGSYTVGPIGTDPTCTINTGGYPHVLP